MSFLFTDVVSSVFMGVFPVITVPNCISCLLLYDTLPPNLAGSKNKDSLFFMVLGRAQLRSSSTLCCVGRGHSRGCI